MELEENLVVDVQLPYLPLPPPLSQDNHDKKQKVLPALTITTGVECDKLKVKWRIENFSVVSQCKHLLENQKFTIDLGGAVGVPCKWEFSLSSIAEAAVPDDVAGQPLAVACSDQWLEIVRKLVKVPEVGMEVSSSCSVKIRNKDKISVFEGKVNYMTLNSHRTFKKVLKLDGKMEEMPLIDGALVIDLTIRIYAKRETCYTGPDASKQAKVQIVQKLKDDLVAMLNEDGSSSSDVKIVSKDGQEYHAHKNILRARNSVFHAMFSSIFLEDKTGIIKLQDLNGKALGILLEYIYGGVLQESWFQPDVIVELTYAAGKYQLTEVLEYLNTVLGDVGIGENAGALLGLCGKLGLKRAEEELLAYVKTCAVPCARSYDDLIAILGHDPNNVILDVTEKK